MKRWKKLLIGAAGLLMLFVVCSIVLPGIEEADQTPTVEETLLEESVPEDCLTPEEDIYAAYLYNALVQIGELTDKLADQLQEAAFDEPLLTNTSWQKESLSIAQELHTIGEGLFTYPAPKSISGISEPASVMGRALMITMEQMMKVIRTSDLVLLSQIDFGLFDRYLSEVTEAAIAHCE